MVISNWFARCRSRGPLPAFEQVGRRLALAFLCVLPSVHAVTEIRTSAHEDTQPKFVVGAGAGSPSITGMCIDIFRAIERLEPDLRFVGDQTWMPMTRHEAVVVSGSQDTACGLIRTPDREAKFIYLEPPLFTVNYVLVARADDNIQIKSWDDVRALGDAGAILVTAGHGPSRYLSSLGGLVIDSGGKSAIQNLQKLVSGRGRFLYHRSPGVEGEIRRAGLNGKVKILPTAMHATNLYLLMGKHVPSETVKRVQAALTQLEKSGELVRLLKKWQEE